MLKQKSQVKWGRSKANHKSFQNVLKEKWDLELKSKDSQIINCIIKPKLKYMFVVIGSYKRFN